MVLDGALCSRGAQLLDEGNLRFSILWIYISTGSLNLCLEAFLPLGLPAGDPFWKDPDAAWTAKRVWSGGDLASYHALDGFRG